jgi:GH24 family phage-related lysozyme (muramidase)
VRTSRHGVEFIAGYEGFRDHPYRHRGDVWTIGYGHTGPGVASMGKITRAKGIELLTQDVRSAEQAVNALGLTLTQGQFDAVVSFVFNCGPGTLAPSRSLGHALREPGMKGVPAAMALYTRDGLGRVLPGLVRRRAAEGTMFGKPGVNGPAAWLTAKELRRCRELDKLRKLKARTPAQEQRIGTLVSRLTQQRKVIWQKAQPRPKGDGRGWDHRFRRQRYGSLLARTA